MGTLYIVATPIGNLGDISLRALETLKKVDLVLAEDTRVTKKLFFHYNIHTPLLSYHQHSKENVQTKVMELLSQGKNLALVTDAGTPGVSDPGNELIAYLSATPPLSTPGVDRVRVKIVPIPGVSALTALASVAGVPMDKFLFLGYPPVKRGRAKFFQEIAESKHPVIFYESPHRIQKTLRELLVLDADLQLVVGRELTKAFETIYRGEIGEIIQLLESTKPKGEFVLLISR